MTAPGDLSQALESVLGRFRTMVRSIAARHALHDADLEELIQDLRIRLWRGRSSSEEITALPTSYVYQAATTAALDMLRRRRREAVRTVEASLDVLEGVAQRGGADDGVHVSDLAHRVEAALGRLVPSRRMVVRMSLAGYDRHEIVERLGWSEGRVRNLLSRGMDDLRSNLNDS